MMEYTLNIKGQLVDLSHPQVMGIVNVTPDSFYADSRRQTEESICAQVERMVADGATMIDVGACSTRPGSEPVSQQEEMERLRMALGAIAHLSPLTSHLSPLISVDTFRADVARMAVEEYGADIINDVSEGQDPAMLRMVARLRVPYILMSVQPDLRSTLLAFATKVQQLRDYGQKDIILDPGFGFGKTLEENYRLMNELERLHVMELPLLVGISRKSMIYRLLGSSPEEALNGTTVLNTIALMKGASILRVHDVKQAVECVKVVTATMAQHGKHDNREMVESPC